MKNTILLISVCAALTCCTVPKEEVTTVHLKGQLIDMGSTVVPMSYNGAESMIGDGRDILITTDKEGCFDTILTIKEPTYYDIYRNTLYLSPGDDLTVKITPYNEEAEFKGVGAEVNNYMKYRLFPKGGSFLNGGQYIRKDFTQTKSVIDSLAKVRRNELNKLKEASTKFKKLENARIDADIANSYLMYPAYAFNFRKDLKTREDFKKALDEANHELLPFVKPILKNLIDDELLDVAAVRDVLRYVVNPEDESTKYLADGITLTPFMTEVYQAAAYVYRLREKVTPAFHKEVKTYIESMNYPACKAELNAKLEQAAKLMEGSPAIDFEMTDEEGKTHSLNEWKGKVIYLDFWATWCGACIDESPHFEALAKDFKDQDVVFISISTDKSRETWLSYLGDHSKDIPQYNSLDRVLTTEWAIHFIPRFIVIDKDFKIVDAYAPRPSQPEAKALIEKVLKE